MTKIARNNCYLTKNYNNDETNTVAPQATTVIKARKGVVKKDSIEEKLKDFVYEIFLKSFKIIPCDPIKIKKFLERYIEGTNENTSYRFSCSNDLEILIAHSKFPLKFISLQQVVFFCLISLEHTHNHPVNSLEALSFRMIPDDVKK